MKQVGLIDNKDCDLHINCHDKHQESPNRTKTIREYLKNLNGLVEIVDLELEITDDDILTVHTDKHLDDVKKACKGKSIMVHCSDVYVSGDNSMKSVIAAIKGVFTATDTVLNPKSTIKQVFCNVRPPGHHACDQRSSGFCVFNNVALGVMRALKNKNVNKVLIFDWDLHHGDGTQKIFESNSNVMYCSFHRGPPFYPNSGHKNETGKYNNILNFPLESDVTSGEYLRLFADEFLPRAREFKPDLVFISCGFDSHKDDLYKELPLDSNEYSYMTRCLMDLTPDKKIVSVLEGGYTLDVLGKSVLNHVNTMIDYN